MENKKGQFGILYGFMILLMLMVFCLLIFVAIEETTYKYKMPNGIICKQSYTTGGGFGGATHEFRDCSDGKIYVNPETYRRLKK